MIETDDNIHWFALRIYHGAVKPIISLCENAGVEYYRPMQMVEYMKDGGKFYVEEPIIVNLLFVKSSIEFVKSLQGATRNRAYPYCYAETNRPQPIDDHTMAVFRMVVQKGANHLRIVDFPIDKGDRVRVIDGMFKGAEGYVRRVHGTKLFVVALEGIVAIAVTHIPRQFLERVEK
ncbi:MAG: UpxY family transcription antiterminator [Muribaculaceae bacterium]|nr:UpxY family transcription antiterminator [Muribaculaceae bacterium]